MKSTQLFNTGGSQAVRIPKEFQFACDTVLIQKIGDAVILVPEDKSWEVFMHGLESFTDDFCEHRENI